MTDKTEKNSRLNKTLAELGKKYGKGIVRALGDEQIIDTPSISTGSLGLDRALGIGGFPRGRITEIYGSEGSGKTTLGLHAIAEAQRQGGTALLIDTEHAFDRGYGASIGINTEKLLVCQPDYGEQALDIAQECIESEGVDIVLLDSIAALLPEAELKGTIGEQHIGSQARLMSQAMRKLVAVIHKTGVVCIFINQIRHKIGVFFGSPETTSGGNAPKFYASVRLDVRKAGQLKDAKGQIIGQEVKVKIVKNKLAAPFKEVVFELIYGRGISRAGEIVDSSVSLGVVQQKGSWFSYKSRQLAQGREAFRELLESDPALQHELIGEIKKAHDNKV